MLIAEHLIGSAQLEQEHLPIPLDINENENIKLTQETTEKAITEILEE